MEILNPILKVEKPSEIGRGTSISGKHHPLFIKLLEDQLGCKAEDILDVELCFADFEPGRIGGCFDEYIFAPRLDNLCCCFASLKGLIDADETLQASRGYSVTVTHKKINSAKLPTKSNFIRETLVFSPRNVRHFKLLCQTEREISMQVYLLRDFTKLMFSSTTVCLSITPKKGR